MNKPFSFFDSLSFHTLLPKDLTVDKILTYSLIQRKCSNCGFNNQFEHLEICPDCGEKLLVMKGDCNEKSN